MGVINDLCQKCQKRKKKQHKDSSGKPMINNTAIKNLNNSIKESLNRQSIEPTTSEPTTQSQSESNKPKIFKNPDREKSNKLENYFTREQLNYYSEKYDQPVPKQQRELNFSTIKKGDLIGQGAYGKVYLGLDEEDGKLLAIKEINLEKLDARGQLEVINI